jgi:hypothetical protein
MQVVKCGHETGEVGWSPQGASPSFPRRGHNEAVGEENGPMNRENAPVWVVGRQSNLAAIRGFTRGALHV